MFNLRRLEDRIVLDGAAMADALDEIQEQHQHDLEMHFQALEAHNAQDWDYGLDIDEPLYLTDGFDAPESADDGLHVLVISSDIADADDLADAAKDGVLVVRHDASDNIEDLAASINKALGGKDADSIAFAAHSGADFFDLDALDAGEYQEFWGGVGNLLADGGRIDLLGCNVLDGDDGEQLVTELEKLTGANVAASTDATGNDAYGGDWVLESDGVDIQGTYFDADRLENFEGILNQAPTLDNEIPDQTVNQGEDFVFTIPANTFSDPDGDDLTYWSFDWDHPTWMQFDGAQTFTGTPDVQADVDTWDVTVSATDPDWAGVTDIFQVTVNDVQEYPEIGSQIAPIDVDQKTELSFAIPTGTFYDPDDDTWTYSLQDNPTWLALEGSTLTGTPNYQADVGKTTIKLVATDTTGLATAMYIDVTVNDTNDAPVVANFIADMTLEQGDAFVYTLPADTFSDPDGDDLSYWSFDWEHPSWMSFDAATGTFTGTPDAQEDVGTHTVTVSATDPGWAGASESFDITVTDVNNPPETVMAIEDVDIVQYESTTFSVVANFEDPDPGDTVRYHAEITLPDNSTKILTEDDTYWMYLDPNTGEFTINPTAEDHVDGTPWTVEVYAVDQDEDRSLDALTFEVAVTNFNDAPVTVNMPIVNPDPVYQGESVPFDISSYFEDPEGETLAYWSFDWEKPDWMTLDGATGIFTIAPTSDESAVGTHTITVSATDPAWAGVTTTFQVEVLNEPDFPPDIHNINGDTLIYEENDGAVTLDQGADAFISDIDSANFDGGQLKVQITDGLDAAEDQLSIADGGGIDFEPGPVVSYNGEQIGVVTGHNTGTLTIDLTANADTAAVSQLLKNITYENTDVATPTVDTRTVQIDFADGAGGTATASEMTIEVSAVNTAPLHENLEGDFQVYGEGDAPVLIDLGADAIITDADSLDFNGGFLEVKIVTGYRTGDTLDYTGADIGTVTYPTPNTMRIDFNDGVTATDVQNFIRTITYENTDEGDPPEGERKIRLLLNDGDGGTTVIDPTIDVGGINDAPVITDDGAVQDFVEDGTPVLVDVGTAAIVEDVDSADFDGGKLVVQITDNFVAAEDKLSINSQGNLGNEISFDGVNVRYSNVLFATVSEPAAGVLEISFTNEDATPEAVQALIRNITYENTAGDTPTEDVRTIEFQLWDGDRGDAPHVNESAPVEMSVSVHPVNDQPVISGFEHNLDFVEGDDAIVLDADSNALVADVDSDNFDDGYLTVQITDGAVTSEDMLEIREAGGLGVTLPGNLTYNGNAIATIEGYGTASMKINFDSAVADDAAVSAVLQNITYANDNSESPTVGVRTIEFQLNDGDGTEFGGLGMPDSDSVTMTVTVNEANDPPVLANVSTDATYFEDTSPGVIADPIFVDVDQAATVSDIDNENFDGGKLIVEISDNYLATEDALSIKNDPTEGPDRIGFDGKDVTYNFKTFGTVTGDESGTLTVTFNENADTGAVAELIKNVTYQNINHEDPSETDRVVSFTMWDGDGFDAMSSMTQDVTVHVVGHPDDPVISNLDGDDVDYTEDGEPVILDVGGNALVTDVDSTSFAGGQLRAEIVEGGDIAEDMLTISTDSGVINYHTDGAVSYMDGKNDILIGWAEFSGGNLLKVDLTDDADEENVSALIQNIAYSNTDVEDLTEGTRRIEFTLRDAADSGNPDDVFGLSDPVSVTVNVGDANDAPIIENLDGDSYVYEETEGAVLVDQSAAPFSAAYVTDVDGGGENFDGGNLTVEIDGYVAGEDTISVNTDGGHLDIYNEKYITYDSVQIGTITFDAVNGIWDVDLTAEANETTVSELVQSIEYNNTDSYSPTAGERTLRFTLSDGQAGSGPYNVTLDVLSPNDDPVINNISGETFTYIEDSGPLTLDNSDASVRDVDGVDFDGGKLVAQIVGGAGLATTEDVLSIANGDGITFNDGANVYYNGVQFGQVTFTAETGLLNVALDEDATEDAVSQLLRNITYENANTGNPEAGEREVRFGVWDGDGGSSGYSSMTVTVMGKNDAPEIANLDGDEVTYKEDGGSTAGAVALDDGTDAVVTDADMTDFGGGTLTVKIIGGDTDEDVLFVNDAGWTSDFNASLGELTVTLTDATDASDVSHLIHSIEYYNSDTGMPTLGQRTVEFTLNDGHGTDFGGMDTVVSTVTLNVEATNDPPVIEGIDGSMAYLEGDGKLDLANASDVLVTDVDSLDFDGGVLTVRIENGDPAEDILTIRDDGNDPTRIGFDGVNVYYGGVSIGQANFVGDTLSVNLNSEDATPTSVSALMHNIQYQNIDEDNPTEGVRNIGFSLFDGDGGTTVFTYMSVEVRGVNDAPVISNVDGDAVTFDEGDGTTNSQVLLDDGGNALVEDVDSDDFNSGQLTVTILNPELTEDELSIRNEGVGAGQLGFHNGSLVSYGGDVIGEAAFVGSTLTVTFTSSHADAEAVSALIQNVSYYNTATIDPAEGTRSIRFQLNDGDGTDDGGVETSAFHMVNVTVNDLNDPPAIHDIDGDSLAYMESDGAVLLDQVGVAATVTDLDSPDFEGGHLHVWVVDGYVQGEDTLGIVHEGSAAGQIGVYGDVITYGEDQIGSSQFDPATGLLDITLYDDANTESVAALIQQITYENTDTIDPTGGNRTIRFSLSDGDGNDSTTYDTLIRVQPDNSAPVLDGIDGSIGYLEGDGPVLLDVEGDASVSDIENDNFTRLTVQVMDSPDTTSSDDVLTIRNEAGGIGEISYSKATGQVFYEQNAGGGQIGDALYNPATGLLDITLDPDAADAEAVSALLQSIQYENGNEGDPAQGDRNIEFRVWDDEGASSNLAQMTVSVTGVNDQPVIENLHGDAVTFTEFTAGDQYSDVAVRLDANLTALVNDIDNTDFDGGHLRIEILNPEIGDRLYIPGDPSSTDFIDFVGPGVNYSGAEFGTVDISGTENYYTGTGAYVLDITLDEDATTEAVAALIRHIHFNVGEEGDGGISAGPIAGDRTIRFELWDGDGTAFGGIDGSGVHYDVNVTVEACNDAPVFNFSDGFSQIFIEDSSPVFLAQGCDLGVTDIDSHDFDNGTLEVKIVGGLVGDEDWLSIADNDTNDDTVRIAYDGNIITYNGTEIGAGTYVPGTGELDIVFNENADSVAVSAVLNSITYENLNHDDPVTAAAQGGERTIRFRMWDGDGTAGQGCSDSAGSVFMSLSIQGVNDAPIIENLAGDATSFCEARWTGATGVADNVTNHAVFLDYGHDATVGNVDLGSHGFSGGHLTIDIQPDGDLTDGDVLGIRTAAAGELSLESGASYSVLYNGNAFASFAETNFSTNSLDITFTSEFADNSSVSALIQSIAFANVDTIDPSAGQRTVRFTLWDGDLTEFNGADGSKLSYDVNVSVTPVNDGPVMHDFNTQGLHYSEGHATAVSDVPQLSLQASAVFSDLDSDDFDGGKLTVQFVDGTKVGATVWSPDPDDRLSITEGAGISMIGDIVMFNGEQIGSTLYGDSTLTVNLTENAETLAVEALINSVAFSNVDIGNPVEGTRTIRFQLSDGDGVEGCAPNDGLGVETSGYSYVSLYLQATNDAPEFHNIDTTPAVAFCESNDSMAGTLLDTNGLFELTDADAEMVDATTFNFSGATLNISIQGSDTAEDILSVRSATGEITYLSGDPKDYENATLVYNGCQIANMDYDSDAGVLSIDFDQRGSDLVDETIVSMLLQNIEYMNSDSFGPTEGTRTIRFAFSDGDTKAVWGGDGTAEAFMHLEVKGVNDGPTYETSGAFDLDGANYSEASSFAKHTEAETLIFGATTIEVTDEDGSDFAGAKLSIQIVDGPDDREPGEDILGFSTGGDIDMAGDNPYSGTVAYQSKVIGDYTWNPDAGRLDVDISMGTLAGNEYSKAMSELIGNITYTNADSQDPTAGTRTLRVVLTDGDGISNGSCPDGANTMAINDITVQVTAVNDRPEIFELDGDISATYFERDDTTTGLLVDRYQNAFVRDVDSDYFSTLTVQLTSPGAAPAGEDSLSIRNEGMGDDEVGFDGVNLSYDGEVIGNAVYAGDTLTVDFDPEMADAEAVSAVIQNVMYLNSNDVTPFEGDRTIRFVVEDYDRLPTGSSNDTSLDAFVTIHVMGSADAPEIRDLDGDATTFTESDYTDADDIRDDWALLDNNGNASAYDADTFADASDLAGGELTIQILGNDGEEDRLGFQTATGVIGHTASGTSTLTDAVNTHGTLSYQGSDIATYTWNQAAGLMKIDFEDDAGVTSEAVSALIQNITYYNLDTETPTLTDRTVRFVLWDGDPDAVDPADRGLSSDIADVTVTVLPDNDAPIIHDLENDTVVFVEEQGPVALDAVMPSAASVTDVDSEDFDGGHLRVRIDTSGLDSDHDVLGVISQGMGPNQVYYDGLNVYHSGQEIGYGTYANAEGVLDITLNENADEVSVSALLQQVSYDSTDTMNPAATDAFRTVRFTLSDGDGDISDIVSVTVGVRNVNDAPQISNLEGDVLVFSEADGGSNDGKFLDIAQNAQLKDVDSTVFDGGQLTVQITSGLGDDPNEDWLGISDHGTLNVTYDGTTNTYTIAGGAGNFATATWSAADHSLTVELGAKADTDVVEELIQSITYANLESNDPTAGDRNVQFQLNDGDGDEVLGLGDPLSDEYNMTVRVEPVNDAPELLDVDDHNVYNETVFDGGHMVLDTDAAVADVDNENFDGGSLTVQITSIGDGYDETEDRLGISAGAHLDFNDGQNIFYDGIRIGEASFEPINGTFTISLTEGANTTTVSELMKSITYYNLDSDDPTDGDRTIRFTFNDGAGGSLTNFVTVTVEEVNDAPELQNLDGDEVWYAEGDDPVLLDVDLNAEVTDPDNAHFNEAAPGVLHVAIGAGGVVGEDRLSILDDDGNSWDQIDVRDHALGSLAGSDIYYGGTHIADAVYAGTTLDVTLNANADEEAVSALIQHIQYENLAGNNPTEGERRVDFWLEDGGNAEDANVETSLVSSVALHVEAVNDPPVITSLDGDTFDYFEEDGEQIIQQGATGINVVDVDSSDFADGVLTVQIANPVATEDVLAITDAGGISLVGNNVVFGGSTIGTSSFDANTGTLTVSLTEHADTASAEALIEAISYENTNTENPTEGWRSVQFTLSDGDGATSEISEARINVIDVNDAPRISNVDGDAVTFVEGTETVLLDVDADASISDVDTTSFGDGVLEVVAEGGVDNVLSVRDNGPIEVLENGAVFYNDEQIGFSDFVDATSTLRVTLTDAADKEAVDALIASVEYGNSNLDDLADDTRTVRFRLYDGDNPAAGVSGDASDWSEVTVNLNAVNDPPVIHDLVDDEAVLYTEGAGRLVLDRAEGAFSPAYVTDVDDANFSSGELKVEIQGYVQGEDGLTIESDAEITFSGNWGDTVFHNGTPIGTATWNDAHGVLQIALNAAADTTAVSDLIQTIAFENTNEMDPMEGNRTVRFSLLDGDASDDGEWSDPADVVVTVQDVNDPPVITNVDGDTQAYDEDDVDPVRLDNGLDAGVIDVDSSDFDGGRLEVVIDGGYDPGNDMLTIQNIPGESVGFDGVYVTYDGAQVGTATYVNGTLTVNFNVGEPVGTEVASEIIRSVSYYNRDMDDYLEGEYARTIRFTLSDGDEDGESDPPAQMTLFVRPVNSAPEIHDLAGDTLSYVEGDGAVRVDQYLGDAVAASVTDGDSPDFDGGTLTVQVLGDGLEAGEDVLAINNEGNGIEQIGINAATNQVSFDGDVIGVYGYDAASQLLTVTFDNDADEDAVTKLIQSITYENTDTIDPVGGERTIRFTLSDGDGATSENYDVFLDVIPVNDAPVIHNLDGDLITYTETDGSPDRAMVIDNGGFVVFDAAVEDLDSAGYQKLTVQIVANGDPDEDVLWVQNEGNGAKDIGISEFGDLTYGGVDIGDAMFDESNGLLTVTFNENANDESVSSLIQNVTYNNVDSDDPTDATREVRFTVWDDAGASGDSVTAFVNVDPVNDAPRIQNIAGDSATFEEGGDPILIDEGLDGLVLDHDGPENDGQLIIEIDGANPGEDLLDIKLTQELTNLDDVESTEGFIYLGDIEDGVVLFYDGSHVGSAEWDAPVAAGGTGQLTLNLKDDADFEEISTAFIQSITYGNDADDLEDSVRTIRFSAVDALGASSTWYEMSLFVKGVNDPPVINDLAGDSVTFSKNDDPVLLDVNSPIVVGDEADVLDADTDNLRGGQLDVEIYSGVVADEDFLSISTVSGEITLANDNVFVNGVKIGTYDENGRSLEVIFTEDVTENQASTLLQNISYENLNTVDPTAGNRTVRFTIDDGEDVNSLSDAVETVVRVEGNRDPVIDEGIVPDEWPVQLDVFNRFTINGDAFMDADNDDLSYTATLANGDPLPDWISVSEEGTFLAIPTDEDQEDLEVIVYANDGVPHPGDAIHSHDASAMMTVTIADAGNAVPTFEDMSVSFMISEHQDENVGQVLEGFTVAADYQVGDPVYTVGQTIEPVQLVATDDAFGGDATLTYSIEAGGAGNFTIDPDTGEIVLVAADDIDFETGDKSFTLTIRATDADGLFNEGTLTIFVNDENDDPVVAEPIPDQDVSVATFGGTSGWRYDFKDTFADPDNDSLTYTAVLVDGFAAGSDESYTRSTTDNFRDATGWLNFSSSSEIFFGIPTTGDIRTFTIDLWVDDGTADPVVETFEINVIASLNMELRDALRYLDMDAEELYLPVDGEDLEIHDVAMYAQASEEVVPVDTDMMEALELLDDGEMDQRPSDIV